MEKTTQKKQKTTQVKKQIKKDLPPKRELALHLLKTSLEEKRSRKRLGRGIGSNKGKTSTRGHKGQRSRSGHKINARFEGGQMPFYRRLPKLRGFKKHNPLKYQIVNLEAICKKELREVTRETLFKANLIRTLNQKVKILGVGELKHVLTVKVDQVSKKAQAKILSANGKIELI